MTKIRNRFTGELITVHDNLLFDIYNLNSNCIYSKEINNAQYFISKVQGRGYLIGLRTKIPEELLTINNKLYHFDQLDEFTRQSIEDTLSNKLTFSDLEIFVANILLDKYLRFGNNCRTSIRELEGYYRQLKNNYSKVRVTKNVFNRYVDTLKSLVEKELFLETNSSFRKDKYGARNISFSQKFLNVYDVKLAGMNNIEFNFSFGNFGSVLKNCRRYSNTLSRRALNIRLNQAAKYVTEFNVARDIFIRRRNPKGAPSSLNTLIYEFKYYNNKVCGNSMNSKEYVPNKLRKFRKSIEYTRSGIEHCNVFNYKEAYSYNETEQFELKHEFDYDINSNLDYKFSDKDISEDVSLTFHVIL